jgi:hypothetical protein
LEQVQAQFEVQVSSTILDCVRREKFTDVVTAMFSESKGKGKVHLKKCHEGPEGE